MENSTSTVMYNLVLIILLFIIYFFHLGKTKKMSRSGVLGNNKTFTAMAIGLPCSLRRGHLLSDSAREEGME